MRLSETFRRFGIMPTTHLLAYKVAKRCVDLQVSKLMHRDLRELPPREPQRDDISFRTLTHDEVVGCANDTDMDLAASMALRLSGGFDHCFAAIADDQIVAYYWLATDSIEATHNSTGGPRSGVALAFPEDVVYGYKAYVHPQHRGDGLYADLVDSACHWARRQLKVNHLVSTVDWTNHAALRSCRRQGLRSLGHVWRFGVSNQVWTLSPRAAKAKGIRFGNEAVCRSRRMVSHGDQ